MLHSKSTKDPQRNALPANNTTVPRRPTPVHPTLPTPKPSSAASRSTRPPVKKPLPSTPAPTTAASKKPSALPRSTSGHTTQRLDTLVSSRAFVPSESSQGPPQHSRTGSEDVPLIYDFNLDQALPAHLSSRAPHLPRQATSEREAAMSGLDMEQDTVLGIALPTEAVF